jgi:hypothetical protein
MTRRRIIFKDVDGKLYVTPEFNGDKKEFKMFCSDDTCMLDWDEILKLFEGVTTIKEFRTASKEAQSNYISSFCTDVTNVFPIMPVKSIEYLHSDHIYLIDNGIIQQIK